MYDEACILVCDFSSPEKWLCHYMRRQSKQSFVITSFVECTAHKNFLRIRRIIIIEVEIIVAAFFFFSFFFLSVVLVRCNIDLINATATTWKITLTNIRKATETKECGKIEIELLVVAVAVLLSKFVVLLSTHIFHIFIEVKYLWSERGQNVRRLKSYQRPLVGFANTFDTQK